MSILHPEARRAKFRQAALTILETSDAPSDAHLVDEILAALRQEVQRSYMDGDPGLAWLRW